MQAGRQALTTSLPRTLIPASCPAPRPSGTSFFGPHQVLVTRVYARSGPFCFEIAALLPISSIIQSSQLPTPSSEHHGNCSRSGLAPSLLRHHVADEEMQRLTGDRRTKFERAGAGDKRIGARESGLLCPTKSPLSCEKKTHQRDGTISGYIAAVAGSRLSLILGLRVTDYRQGTTCGPGPPPAALLHWLSCSPFAIRSFRGQLACLGFYFHALPPSRIPSILSERNAQPSFCQYHLFLILFLGVPSRSKASRPVQAQ